MQIIDFSTLSVHCDCIQVQYSESIVKYRYSVFFIDFISFIFNKRPNLHLVSLFCKNEAYCKPCIFKIWFAPILCYDVNLITKKVTFIICLLPKKIYIKVKLQCYKNFSYPTWAVYLRALLSSLWLLVTEKIFQLKKLTSFLLTMFINKIRNAENIQQLSIFKHFSLFNNVQVIIRNCESTKIKLLSKIRGRGNALKKICCAKNVFCGSIF